MSLKSSSKPQSVAANFGNESKFTLVFKQTVNGKKLTQDALYVCQLLAISPDDLIQKDLDSFAEKGLSEKRQQLRFEHYEEKRLLKLRAIQNVLLKCQLKDQSQEGQQVQALIDDLKRQKSSANFNHQASQMNRSYQYSPFKTQKLNQTQFMGANPNSSMIGGGALYDSHMFHESSTDRLYHSQAVEYNAQRQLDRVKGKLEKWNKTKEMADRKKLEHEEKLKRLMQTEKKKFERIEKSQKEQMEDLKARLEQRKNKWVGKINMKLDEERKAEKEKTKKALELVYDTTQYIEEKKKRELEFYSRLNRPELPNVDVYYTGSQMQSISQNGYSPRAYYTNGSDDGQTEQDLQKFQEKLKQAEERIQQKMQSIRTRGQHRSLVLQERRTMQQQKEQEKLDSLLNKTYVKAMRAQSKQDSRIKEINRAAQKLSLVHKQKEFKLKQQQDEERRTLQEQLKMLSRKQEQKEAILKQKKDQIMEEIIGKKEKRKLQFQDKEENEKRIRALMDTHKRSIFEKHLEKDKKIQEMKNQWLQSNQSFSAL